MFCNLTCQIHYFTHSGNPNPSGSIQPLKKLRWWLNKCLSISHYEPFTRLKSPSVQLNSSERSFKGHGKAQSSSDKQLLHLEALKNGWAWQQTWIWKIQLLCKLKRLTLSSPFQLGLKILSVSSTTFSTFLSASLPLEEIFSS